MGKKKWNLTTYRFKTWCVLFCTWEATEGGKTTVLPHIITCWVFCLHVSHVVQQTSLYLPEMEPVQNVSALTEWSLVPRQGANISASPDSFVVKWRRQPGLPLTVITLTTLNPMSKMYNGYVNPPVCAAKVTLALFIHGWLVMSDHIHAGVQHSYYSLTFNWDLTFSYMCLLSED